MKGEVVLGDGFIYQGGENYLNTFEVVDGDLILFQEAWTGTEWKSCTINLGPV